MQRTARPSWSTVALIVVFVVSACGAPPGGSSSLAAVSSPSATATPMPTPTPRPSREPTPTPAPSGPIVPAEVVAANTTPYPVKAIAAGWNICAIREDGTIGCWGDARARPPKGRFTAIDSAGGSTCAIRVDGRLACWGEIGTKVPKGTYSAVSVDQGDACAIRRTDARLTCWQAPNEDDEDAEDEGVGPILQPPAGRFTAVSSSGFEDCALRQNGELVCWGLDELEATSADSRYTSVDLPCAIRLDGTLDCLTYDEFGESPARWVSRDGTYTAVSAADGRGCGLRTDGTLDCWGEEGYSDDEEGDALPMRAPGGTYTAVSVGEMLACALKSDGHAVCWGEDDEVARPGPTMWFETPVVLTTPAIPLRWGALSAFAPVTAYDIDRITKYDEEGVPIAFEPFRVGTKSTHASVDGKPGIEYCWRARAHDADGRISAWTGDCTTLPNDDSVFSRSAGWSTVHDARYYLGRASSTTKKGATLTVDVDALGLTLFATRCPTCGSIKVYVGGSADEAISLRSPARHDRQIVWYGDNGEEGYWTSEGDQSGHIVIKVVSSGRPVIIDGLLQGPSLDEEIDEPF